MKFSVNFLLFWMLVILDIVVDAVQLIRENGFRPNSYFYHLGDGSHAYHAQKDTASSIYFKCVMYDKLKCSGRVIYRFGGGFRHTQRQNHPPDPDYVGERHFRQNILDEIEGARFVSFEDVLNDFRKDFRYSRRVRSGMTMRRLRGAMYRARMRRFPQIPNTLQELTQILLDPDYKDKVSSTVDKEDNLYSGSCTAADGSHHVVFISERMREFMGEITIIQSDGTFKARPLNPYSSQIFVLVTPWRNCSVPLGWVLMESRTREGYRKVLELLKHLCPGLNPALIITDWERPQQMAWQEAFPNATIQGCLWHMCRAFLRKAAKLHILRFRKNLPGILTYLKKACAICLLPSRYFLIGLGVLRDEARAENIMIAYLLEKFFKYVERRWINNRARRSWMRLYRSMHRTNNICESHNKVLRKYVGAYRPNVWAFIDALAKIEHNASLDIALLRRGGAPRRSRAWKSVWNDEQLQALSNDFELDIFQNLNGTVSEFLDRAIRLFPQAFDMHLQNELVI